MEFLNESGRKAKRNLLFFASITWALATGFVKSEASITIGGLGLKTSIGFVLFSLTVLLAFNLISFVLHLKFHSATSPPPELESPKIPSGGNKEKMAEWQVSRRKFRTLRDRDFAAWELWFPVVAGGTGILAALHAYLRITCILCL